MKFEQTLGDEDCCLPFLLPCVSILCVLSVHNCYVLAF